MRFLPLLSSLMSLANVDIGGAVSRRARGVGYTLTAIIFLLTAYVLAVGALAFFLAGHMSTWAALAIIALGFFGMAGIVFWFAGISARAEEERDSEGRNAQRFREWERDGAGGRRHGGHRARGRAHHRVLDCRDR